MDPDGLLVAVAGSGSDAGRAAKVRRNATTTRPVPTVVYRAQQDDPAPIFGRTTLPVAARTLAPTGPETFGRPGAAVRIGPATYIGAYVSITLRGFFGPPAPGAAENDIRRVPVLYSTVAA